MLNEKIEKFKNNGKSFYWASRILNRNKNDKIYNLYFILRELDDIADNQNNENEFFKKLYDFFDMSKNNKLPYRLEKHKDFFLYIKNDSLMNKNFKDFITGLIFDQKDNVIIDSQDELLNYCYRVAGTIGVMMCPILNVKNEHATIPATNLGIAMQLTNIARDVYEDALSNRRYLPSSWTNGIEPKLIIGKSDCIESVAYLSVKDGIKKTIELAEKYYEDAKKGYSYLPLRSRLCIAVAANIYREIGKKIKKENYNWSSYRHFVKNYEKLYITLKSIISEFYLIFKEKIQ